MDGNLVQGDLSGIAQDAHGLQAISDQQAQIMHNLANTMDTLAVALQSPSASPALQAVGDRLQAVGNQFGTQFADHSQMMQNNAQGFDAADQDNHAIFSKIDSFLA
jgi:glutamine synthetase adenylyltransferase